MNQKLQKFLQSLNLKRNTSYRGDCPGCGGHHTFSVTNENGKIKYYCFRNSCNISGGASKEMSIQDIKNNKTDSPLKPLLISECMGWTQWLRDIPAAVEYLHVNNCVDAYEAAPGKFFYDKIRDRLIFVEYSNHTSLKLATGRSLRGETPKWYKYVAFPGEYYVALYSGKELRQNSNVLYVVEDCASACSISRCGHGLALCGTNYDTYSLLTKATSLNVDNIVICLDADAQLKALKLQRDLQGLGKIKEVKVVQLSNDAKYLDKDTLNKDLNNGY